MPQKMTTRLKELFNRPQIFVLAGGFGPYGAKMAEFLGYEAFYMSGANSSANTIGWPDVGMMSMREMVDNARRIVAAVNIPVFADSDTGYGNAVSVYRTVREYVLAGVAGIHLEDQEHPKKSGSMAGRRCISTEEMIGKLRAAVDARNEVDPDFVICARCDFRGAEGGSFEGVMERCLRYKEVPGVETWCSRRVSSPGRRLRKPADASQGQSSRSFTRLRWNPTPAWRSRSKLGWPRPSTLGSPTWWEIRPIGSS